MYQVSFNMRGRRVVAPRMFRTKVVAERAIVQAKRYAKSGRTKYDYKPLKNPRIIQVQRRR